MKCERVGAECETPDRCELLGCLLRLGGAHRPIPPSKPPAGPSCFERWASRLRPKPAAIPTPAPPAADERDVMEQIKEILMSDQPGPAPAAPPITPPPVNAVWSPPGHNPGSPLKAVQRPRDVRVVSVPTGGFLIIEDNAPVAIGMDAAQIGAALAKVLA